MITAGAAKGHAILNGLTTEVKLKLVNFYALGKVLQLLRRAAASAAAGCVTARKSPLPAERA